MNETQLAAVNEEIADDNLTINQAKKSLSLHNGALQGQQAKLAALKEGLS